MIVDSVQIGDNDNSLTMDGEFYACGYDEGTKIIGLITPEDAPIEGKLRSKFIGFGSDSWAELQQEIENRGLEMPNV